MVARFPERIAAADESTSLSYRELVAAADMVAGLLIDCGVRPGDLVALGLSRSVAYLVAMLGVLRGGAVYVPLDPAEPVVRTQAAIAGLGVRLLLTDGAGWSDIGVPLAFVPALAPADPGVRREQPGIRDRTLLGGDQPCYVMFTSGTTGPPKAVVVPHRGVTTLVWRPRFAPLGPGEVVLQLAPLHFDAATFEVWGALCNGATVVVAPRSVLDGGELGDLIARFGVTVLCLTAGLFRVLADERPDCFTGLRCLLTGGDVLSARHVRAIAQRFPGLRLVACYGPTEGTTFTSVAMLSGPLARPFAEVVPLGEPLPGRRLEILDVALRPALIDEPGELYVGGVGLALGYLGQPGRTAERFVADPRSREPGDRLYRTGDLARRRPDGTLEFLGRVDDQVKIRGVRIEPAEVEAALIEHPSVRDAVVRPRGPVGEAVLVGYLAVASGQCPAEHELREFLRARLPIALIPTTFVTMDRFPTTLQGKIDRAALDRSSPAVVAGPVTVPRSLEELVREAWRDCLEREVALDDNVFELGAHSLMGLHVAAILEGVIARPVPLRVVMEHPTARALAGRLSMPDTAPRAPGPHGGTASAMEAARLAADLSAASDDELAMLLPLLAPEADGAGDTQRETAEEQP